MLDLYNKMIEQDYGYDSNIRMKSEEKFKKLCSSEFDVFKKYFALAKEVEFVLADYSSDENKSKEFYTRLIHMRSIDHFMSANILYAKNFVIDSITLVRSAIEDLWVIQNFWCTDDYFNKWNNGCKIQPGKLRKCINIDAESKKLYKKIYPWLCDISHCRKDSILTMCETHEQILLTNKDVNYKKQYMVLVGSFYVYLIGIINVIYINDKRLKEIKEKLQSISREVLQNLNCTNSTD